MAGAREARASSPSGCGARAASGPIRAMDAVNVAAFTEDEHPIAMIRAIRAVVHDKHSPGEAFELFQSLKSAK